jgi:membrane protein involved in colicin uptake
MKTLLGLLLVLFVLVSLTGCAQLQELQERLAQAEKDWNASTVALQEARKEFEAKQEKLNEKQNALEIAVKAGDFELAKVLTDSVADARVEAATANEKVKTAEKQVDRFADAKTMAERQLEDANDPWDYILGGLSIIGTVFGVGGLGNSMRKQPKPKPSKQ